MRLRPTTRWERSGRRGSAAGERHITVTASAEQILEHLKEAARCDGVFEKQGEDALRTLAARRRVVHVFALVNDICLIQKTLNGSPVSV